MKRHPPRRTSIRSEPDWDLDQIVVKRLMRLGKGWTVLLSLSLAALIGILDYATSYELAVSALYLAPVVWACWGAGRAAGIFLSAICTFIWGLADVSSGHLYQHPAILCWNGLMLLTLFVVVVYSLSAFQVAHKELLTAMDLVQNTNARLEETVQQRTAALRAEIAERHRLERLKLEAERLLERREKLAVLGTLAAGIAHEIRNPLTALKARIYTLEKRIQGIPAARHDTEIISSEISRMEHLVQGVLSFARPSDPTLRAIEADTLLREVGELMAPGLESRGVKLVVEASSGLMMQADSAHLKQVLVNLVRNAAEAIEGPGTVTLGARVVPVDATGKGGQTVILEVRDTGKGIPPEVEKRLFDPFFSTKETGTGLGLAIAARIIEKHHGTLQYRTQVGKGTTFEVILPTAPEIAKEKPGDSTLRSRDRNIAAS